VHCRLTHDRIRLQLLFGYAVLLECGGWVPWALLRQHLGDGLVFCLCSLLRDLCGLAVFHSGCTSLAKHGAGGQRPG
jgi:hypothetical protein